jgi:hypothetical protein
MARKWAYALILFSPILIRSTTNRLQLTGKRHDLKWIYSSNTRGPVSNKAESILSPYLLQPGEYVSSYSLSESRKQEIQNMATTVGMSIQQALSLRKQLLVQKIMMRSSSLNKNYQEVKHKYNQGSSIQELSTVYDQPPVAILRMILKEKVSIVYDYLLEKDRKNLIKLALREEGPVYETLMNERDRNELKVAKGIDQSSFSNNPNERLTSIEWENQLYNYLTTEGIQYIDEKALYEQQFTSTPDVVFLDDVYINGKAIRWIDSKCFYGSMGSTLFAKKLQEQAARYDVAFQGCGAIIYRYGFAKSLQEKLPLTLLLDSGPLDAYLGENSHVY